MRCDTDSRQPQADDQMLSCRADKEKVSDAVQSYSVAGTAAAAAAARRYTER